MQPYSAAIRQAKLSGRTDWARMQGWIERFICAPNPLQNVVGRRAHPDGGKVNRAQFDAGDKVAHVCPFLVDAIERDLFYIEESPLTAVLHIRKFLTAKTDEFKKATPAYDPIAAGELATMPIGLKALLIFFPNYEPPAGGGADTGVDQIFKWMIIPFLRQGLILGQFYKGCGEEAIHNPSWKKILTAPYLCWVIRYLQPHDHAFIRPGTPGYPIYQKLLPAHLRMPVFH
jgi:hypothetical protein